MIQRIQTLYLLLITGFTACTAYFPLATISTGEQEYSLGAFYLTGSAGEQIQSTLWLGVLLLVAGVVSLCSIFLYKHRMVQVRLCGIELVLQLGALIMEGCYAYRCTHIFADFDFVAERYHLPVVLPLLSMILTWLALRAILKDEYLIQSLNRIR